MSELVDNSTHLKKEEQERTRIGKAAVLEALEKTRGIVTTTSDGGGISRTIFYTWKEEEAEVRKKVGRRINSRLDY